MKSVLRFFIQQPLFGKLLTVVLLIGGLMAAWRLPREAFPPVSFDVVTLTTLYPSASPKEVEKLITIPLEKELKEVDGIAELGSVSAEHRSLIYLNIDPDVAHKNKVVADIERAAGRVKDLPEDAEKPVVNEINSKQTPTLSLALHGNVPEDMLRDYARMLTDRLEQVPGVARVVKEGYRKEEWRVEALLEKLKQYHLGLNEMVGAIRQKSVNMPGGKLRKAGEEALVRTVGEVESPEDVRNVIVRGNDRGYHVRVRDVANVYDDFQETDYLARTQGEQSINLVVIKKESGDSVKVALEAYRVLDQFKKLLPPNISLTPYDDASLFIQRRLDVLVNNGILGVILVLTTLLMFLNFRAALMTALSIPLALSVTLILMQWLHVSVNLISMLGFVIVLGMLVDDAIVVAENFFRYLEAGMSPREAALAGTHEVMMPVAASALTTVLAFAPLLGMTGIMGKFVWSIPWVVITALLASLAVAFFILPAHLATFLRGTGVETKMGHRWIEALRAQYGDVLRVALRLRYGVMAGVLFLFAVALFLATSQMKFILFDARDVELFVIRVEAPREATLQQTSDWLADIEKAVMELPANELENYTAEVGIVRERPGDPMTRYGSHFAQIKVFLTPGKKRLRQANQIIDQLRERMGNTHAFKKLTISPIRTGPPVGKAVRVEIMGDSFETLLEIAAEIKTDFRGMAGVVDIEDTYERGKDEVVLHVDEQKAAEASLTVADIASGVRTAFEGQVATTVLKGEEEVDVRVVLPLELRQNKETLMNLAISNRSGNLIPLWSVARIETRPGVDVIQHLNNNRVVAVVANVDKEKTTSRKVNLLFEKRIPDLLARYPDYQIRLAGEHKDTEQSMRSLTMAFVYALLLNYIILATRFQSLTMPLLLMTTIPLGLMGVVFAFFLHGEALGFMALMGAVGLTGVVVHNAIVMVEFIQRLRLQGMSEAESIVEGAKLRLRPIFLTTVTTLFGLLPTAYGMGGNDPFLRPVALALAWGLLVATVFTLLFIPCLYSACDDLMARFGHKLPEPDEKVVN